MNALTKPWGLGLFDRDYLCSDTLIEIKSRVIDKSFLELKLVIDRLETAIYSRD